MAVRCKNGSVTPKPSVATGFCKTLPSWALDEPKLPVRLKAG